MEQSTHARTHARTHALLLLGVLGAGPGCLAASPDAESVPSELVEAEPVLGLEASLAADRVSETLGMLGERADHAVPDGALAPPFPVPFAELSESELRAWYTDTRLLSGRSVEDDLASALLRASETRANLPSERQLGALATVYADALSPVEVTWNGAYGTPQLIEGALYVRRNLPTREVADAFLASWSRTLGDLYPAHPSDRLVHVGSSRTWDDALEEHDFVRMRGDVPFELDRIEVFVSTEHHRMGPGIVERVHALWDRSGAEMPEERWITEAGARAAAAESLHAETRTTEGAWAERRVVCRGVGTPDALERACRPVWLVHSVDPELTASSAPDAALVDAATGEIVGLDEMAPNYDGVVRATSNMPYDTADIMRPLSRARLVSGGGSYVLGVDGSYTGWSAPYADAFVGLENVGSGVPGEMWNRDTAGCSTVPQPHYFTIGLGGTDDLVVAPNNATMLRSQYQTWNLYQWAFRALTPFNNYLQVDDELQYVVTTGSGGGNTVGCGTHMRIVFGARNDTFNVLEDPQDRQVALHEFGHFITECTRGWSAGCSGLLGNPRTMVGETMGHGLGDAFGLWAISYDAPGYNRASLSPLRYNGIGDPADIMLHESEIDGTDVPTMDANCYLGGVYQCTSAEACYAEAHDHPRCMRRAWSLAHCYTLFPTVPQALIQFVPYGTDQSHPSPSIYICIADGYVNGVVQELLMADLTHFRGQYGVADLMATVRDYDWWTQLAVSTTSPGNTLHDLMALRSPRFPVTRAMHHMSTESFAWLDDVGDYPAVAENTRIARGSAITQTNGGATGIGLRFNTTTDVDMFLLSVPPGETYQVTASTSSTSIDLCMYVYREADGAYVGTAGCTDGTANRNASYAITTGTHSRYLVYLANVLGIANVGTYSLTTQTLYDDFPDLVSCAVASRALRAGLAESGTLNSTSDADVHRYDYPAAAGSGPLTFAVSTSLSPVPLLEVFFSADETIPTTPIVMSSTGTVTVAAPVSVGHYYVRVINASASTGSYTVTTTAGSCGTNCSDSGTLAAPRSLPTLAGGEVVDRLSAFGAPWESTSCQDGTACDWFRIELAAGERFSVTSYSVLPGASCDLELAVFTPPDPDGSEYWVPNFALGTRYAAVVDSGGSPDLANGGQLTFIARVAGTHRIAVRANGTGACTQYMLNVARMRADTSLPPPYTW